MAEWKFYTPAENGEYLAVSQLFSKREPKVRILHFCKETGQWSDDNYIYLVKAWMPLPEPVTPATE